MSPRSLSFPPQPLSLALCFLQGYSGGPRHMSEDPLQLEQSLAQPLSTPQRRRAPQSGEEEREPHWLAAQTACGRCCDRMRFLEMEVARLSNVILAQESRERRRGHQLRQLLQASGQSEEPMAPRDGTPRNPSSSTSELCLSIIKALLLDCHITGDGVSGVVAAAGDDASTPSLDGSCWSDGSGSYSEECRHRCSEQTASCESGTDTIPAALFANIAMPNRSDFESQRLDGIEVDGDMASPHLQERYFSTHSCDASRSTLASSEGAQIISQRTRDTKDPTRAGPELASCMVVFEKEIEFRLSSLQDSIDSQVALVRSELGAAIHAFEAGEAAVRKDMAVIESRLRAQAHAMEGSSSTPDPTEPVTSAEDFRHRLLYISSIVSELHRAFAQFKASKSAGIELSASQSCTPGQSPMPFRPATFGGRDTWPSAPRVTIARRESSSSLLKSSFSDRDSDGNASPRQNCRSDSPPAVVPYLFGFPDAPSVENVLRPQARRQSPSPVGGPLASTPKLDGSPPCLAPRNSSEGLLTSRPGTGTDSRSYRFSLPINNKPGPANAGVQQLCPSRAQPTRRAASAKTRSPASAMPSAAG